MMPSSTTCHASVIPVRAPEWNLRWVAQIINNYVSESSNFKVAEC